MGNFFSRFIPAHFHNPVGLAMRVARSGGPEGRFAMMSVPLGILATPLDLALQSSERKKYAGQTACKQPLIFVCGPARSGTSIVAATLIRTLTVGYINNLMAIFPRSPLTASKLFGIRLQNDRIALKTFYGRTAGFASQNDGLFLWDRWLGTDRTNPHPELTPEAGQDMRRFWAALEAHCRRPIVAKNNSLVSCASDVARYLPTARFLCLRRDPVFLAQSLLIARGQIHGDDGVPYGLQGKTAREADPVADVCSQVAFYEQTIRDQSQALGPERFWTVSYEGFCNDPGALVHRVAKKILNVDVSHDQLQHVLPAMRVSKRRRVDADVFQRIVEGLAAKGVAVATNSVRDE